MANFIPMGCDLHCIFMGYHRSKPEEGEVALTHEKDETRTKTLANKVAPQGHEGPCKRGQLH